MISRSLFAALTLVVLAHTASSQTINTYSPYSRFGIGDLRNRSFTQNRAMGGVSQGIISGTAINQLNPASYTVQDSMSFILDFGLDAGQTNYSLGNQTLSNPTMNFHHIAVQFPVTKWWGASLGIQPFSDVGYKLRYVETDPYLLSSIGAIKYYHYGEGGLSQAYFGNAFKPFKGLSVGLNVSYFFGSLDYHSDVLFPSGSAYTNLYKINRVVVRSLAYSVGTQYKFNIGNDDKYSVVLGFTLDNETALKAERIVHSSTNSSMFDTVSYVSTKNASVLMPANYSGGFSFTYNNSLTFAFDYSSQDWTNAKFIEEADYSLTSSNTMRFGLEYCPSPNDLKSYLKRVKYRTGFYQSNTNLNLRNTQIKDYGITFGVGLPLRRTSTSFNLSYEMGMRGTNKDGLTSEKYGIVSFGVTFYDIWFVKRKYN